MEGTFEEYIQLPEIKMLFAGDIDNLSFEALKIVRKYQKQNIRKLILKKEILDIYFDDLTVAEENTLKVIIKRIKYELPHLKVGLYLKNENMGVLNKVNGDFSYISEESLKYSINL